MVGPVISGIVLLLLWLQIGPPALAGMGLIVLLAPLQLKMGNMLFGYRWVHYSDTVTKILLSVCEVLLDYRKRTIPKIYVPSVFLRDHFVESEESQVGQKYDVESGLDCVIPVRQKYNQERSNCVKYINLTLQSRILLMQNKSHTLDGWTCESHEWSNCWHASHQNVHLGRFIFKMDKANKEVWLSAIHAGLQTSSRQCSRIVVVIL